MTHKDFYLAFNQIVSNHTSVEDTTKKLKALSDKVEKSDLKDKVVVDMGIVADLEQARLHAKDKTEGSSAMLEESYEDSYDYYEDSYESSYDEDDN